MMAARDVLEVIAALRDAKIRVWLDGGWGVDALVGEQTREHDDKLCPYPPQGFTGVGLVAGVRVACLTPAVQSLHHVGYDPDEKDCHDMRLLADRFGIDLPGPYRSDGVSVNSA